MISRLSTIAISIAMLATASLAFAAGAGRQATTAPSVVDKQVRVVQLERVEISVKRLPQASR